jgi:hypothetical protein
MYIYVIRPLTVGFDVDHLGQQSVILTTGGKSQGGTSSEEIQITRISYGEIQSQEVKQGREQIAVSR